MKSKTDIMKNKNVFFSVLKPLIFLFFFLSVSAHAQEATRMVIRNIRITYPELERTNLSNACEVIKGTAVLPPGEYIWALVHRFDFMGQWWPQAGGMPIDTIWSFNVCLGELKDIGREFEIAIITLDQTEHFRLNQYLDDARATGKYNPISFPPTTSPAVYRTVIKTGHH